ncbi:hypothetical protein KDA14_02440 [Candidatus Saccharibacteria bacterium]|nr:hypothetical protein [Candidatus Saccharibacteria bacterium]
MRANTTKRRFLAVLFGVLLFCQAAYSPAFATSSSNTIYLSPSKQSATAGQSFTITVAVSAVDSIDEVEAHISYSSAQMTFQDVSYSSSAFETTTNWSGGGGTILIDRSSASVHSGNLVLAVLTFKGTASSGLATISVQSSSTLANGSTTVDAAFGSANIDFGPVPTTAPNNDQTVTKKPINRSAYDITPPVLSDIQTSQTEANSRIITWKTNEASNSAVEYGIDTTYGLSATDPAMVRDHSVTLKSGFLLPNTLFHYRIISVDADGNKVKSTDKTFTTSSVTYTITVRGAAGKPIVNALVTLNGESAYTDNDGVATLPSSAGKQAVSVSYNGTTVSKTVTIIANKSEQLDAIELAAHTEPVPADGLDARYIIYPVVLLFGIALGLSTRARLLKYPLAILNRGKKRLLTMPISMVQMEFGDMNPAHNPYQNNRLFSMWSVRNFFARIFQRPSRRVSEEIKKEMKSANIAKKSGVRKKR